MRNWAVLWLVLTSLVSASGQKLLVFEDKVYEVQIRTVQFSPDRGLPDDNLLPAISPLHNLNLVLEFDDLQDNRENYYAKLVHCTYDWSKSSLMDLDFLREYNEFPINDYTYSGGTYLPYVHYRFVIPPVRVPGNYLLMVYRDGNKSDLILTRRFMIFDNLVGLIQDHQLAGTGTIHQTNQMLNFTIDYSRVQITNPFETVHVVLRQNQRWDNAKFDIKPSFSRESESKLEYRFFDLDQGFNAGNEFRWVDFRSLNFPGQNTGSLNRTVKPYKLYVQIDKPRTDEAYGLYDDLDGNYLIENRDNGDAETGSNYVEVTFVLNPLKPLTDPIYVIGAFNGWQRNNENRMKYFPAKAQYEATILLKQGLYNYIYRVDSPTLPPGYFEGNHFETENVYEVLIYNHTFQHNSDALIGYFVIPVNPH